MTRTQGFTLLELLIVCAIIGILGAVTATTFVSATRRARVGEASAQLAADLQRARSSAQRFNQNSSLRIASASATSYTLTIGTQTPVTRTLPPNTRVSVKSAPLTLTYTAPFGETDISSPILTVSTEGAKSRDVRVLGVTGKVYLRETPAP